MADKPIGERVGILETRMDHHEEKVAGIISDRERRGVREWAIIMAVVSLLLAVIAKRLGFL